MTKIDALLRRLLLLRQACPGAKALVFSQFPDALGLASKALDVMQVCYLLPTCYFCCYSVCHFVSFCHFVNLTQGHWCSASCLTDWGWQARRWT